MVKSEEYNLMPQCVIRLKDNYLKAFTAFASVKQIMDLILEYETELGL